MNNILQQQLQLSVTDGQSSVYNEHKDFPPRSIFAKGESKQYQDLTDGTAGKEKGICAEYLLAAAWCWWLASWTGAAGRGRGIWPPGRRTTTILIVYSIDYVLLGNCVKVIS
jgi:hypothetical protein